MQLATPTLLAPALVCSILAGASSAKSEEAADPPFLLVAPGPLEDDLLAVLRRGFEEAERLLAERPQLLHQLRGGLFDTLFGSAQLFKHEWPYVGQNLHNHGNQRAEAQIGTDTVSRLVEEWRFDVLSGVGLNGLGVSAQPTVADGIAYFADPNGFIYAVDADTGELQWQTEIPDTQFATSPTLTPAFLYIAESEEPLALQANAPTRIFCLDRRKGEIIWDAPLDNSDLPSVIGVPINHLAYGGDTAVVGHRVIVGVGSIEGVLSPGDNAARGSVVAYNRFTGQELWRFFTTSDQSLASPEFGGGVGVWSSPGIDVPRKLLFIGTGQAYECPPGFDRCPPEEFEPGSLASPFSDALLALDYRTGELVWHKQFTPDDVWGQNTGFQGVDRDVGAHPNLFSIRARLPGDTGEKRLDLVGVGDKGGKYYILRRDQPPQLRRH